MIIFSLPLLYSPFISPSKHMVRKNNDNVNVYMQKIKKCKNKLEAVGVFMEDEKLLLLPKYQPKRGGDLG